MSTSTLSPVNIRRYAALFGFYEQPGMRTRENAAKSIVDPRIVTVVGTAGKETYVDLYDQAVKAFRIAYGISPETIASGEPNSEGPSSFAGGFLSMIDTKTQDERNWNTCLFQDELTSADDCERLPNGTAVSAHYDDSDDIVEGNIVRQDDDNYYILDHESLETVRISRYNITIARASSTIARVHPVSM